ncbi:MAG TPA: hypothetical protein DCO75_02990 [Fibrobacteres bacterium]|nr:hypothetical protein [Fibrobacterota bacterium]
MISKSFSKPFSSFFSVMRLFRTLDKIICAESKDNFILKRSSTHKISRFCVLYIALFAAASFAVQLENWRLPYYQSGIIRGAGVSSPSGMFWDDIKGGTDSDSALWPDSVRFNSDHWIIEPSASYTVATDDTLFIDTSGVDHYVNDKKQAQLSQVRGSYWTGQVLNDIRYKNFLLRQTLNVNSRNKDDLDYRGKTDRFAAGKIVEAYCQADWKYGFFRFGRLNRNWSPFPDRSLILSSNTQSYDALEIQLASSVFEFRDMFAVFPYSSSDIDASGNHYNRYLTAHSLNVVLGKFGAVGITETVLFTRSSGLPDLQLINPFSIYTVINTNGEGDGNLMLGLQWNLHTISRNISFKGQVLIDDYQVDNKGPQDQEPNHWGADMGAYFTDFLPLKLPHIVSAEYRYLSRWLYTVAPSNTLRGERYSYLGRSLGAADNDGDCFNLSFLVSGKKFWTANGGISLARKGENSIWSAWKNISADSLIAPDELGYRTEKSFPSGIVERTFDFYLNMRGYYKNLADISFRVDNCWIKNKNNAIASSCYDPRLSLTLSLHYCDFFVRLP